MLCASNERSNAATLVASLDFLLAAHNEDLIPPRSERGNVIILENYPLFAAFAAGDVMCVQ